MSSLFLLFLILYVAWVALLYVALTALRAPRIWGVFQAYFAGAEWESVESKLSANLSNQFEWPMFYFAGASLVLSLNVPLDGTYIVYAAVFLVGRVAHSAVQVFTSNIRLRGVVFSVNFLAVLLLWGNLFWDLQNGHI